MEMDNEAMLKKMNELEQTRTSLEGKISFFFYYSLFYLFPFFRRWRKSRSPFFPFYSSFSYLFLHHILDVP
jgi:hypothetical protein